MNKPRLNHLSKVQIQTPQEECISAICGCDGEVKRCKPYHVKVTFRKHRHPIGESIGTHVDPLADAILG